MSKDTPGSEWSTRRDGREPPDYAGGHRPGA